MEIKILGLKLQNFKGIKTLNLPICGESFDVYGDNGTGKTTIFDAFSWLMFGKDSLNRKDFSIKTLDKDGNVISGLEHSVEAILMIDNKEICLKKTYTETWTKKRGEADKVFSGHTIDYWVNEVPSKAGEYEKFISEIIDENIFKLITNPLFFNTQMKWQDRRKLLLDIVGNISDETVYSAKSSLNELKTILAGKKIDDYKKIIAERTKKLNAEINQIPIRIDEINRNMPVLDANIDYAELEEKKQNLKVQSEQLELELSRGTKAIEYINKVNKDLYEAQRELENLEKSMVDDANKFIKDMVFEKAKLESSVELLSEKLKQKFNLAEHYKIGIAGKESLLQSLREKWGVINKERFNDTDCNCPTCKQVLPEAEKLKLIANFENAKKTRLQQINATGKVESERLNNLKQALEDTLEQIKAIETEISDSKITIGELSTKLENVVEIEVNYAVNPKHLELRDKINTLKSELEKPLDSNTEETIKAKAIANKELEEINLILANKETIENNISRIENLKVQERELSTKLIELEKQTYLIEDFIRTKVDMLEEKINEKFKFVKFKLFDTQLNGGLNECCEVLINGVPFSDANNAAKNNAGIDVINTLNEHFKVTAPIFIDNRESINNLLETKSQVINLFVSNDKKLTYKNKKYVEVV